MRVNSASKPLVRLNGSCENAKENADRQSEDDAEEYILVRDQQQLRATQSRVGAQGSALGMHIAWLAIGRAIEMHEATTDAVM